MSKRLLDRRWPWIAAATLIVVAFLSTFVEIHLPGDPRPTGSAEDIVALRERDDLNLLFILIDTLRADRLGMYGYDRETSPELDRLAAGGVRFDRHLAQSSWTKCSMASLWTSLNPARNGVTRFDHVVPDAAVLPAERLQKAGFRTAALYRNGWVAPNFGFEQGFEVYLRPSPKPIPPSVRLENPTVKMRGTDDDALTGAIEFLRIHGDERWFLYLHLMDVHEYVYDEDTALFGGGHSDIYDNSIRWTDRIIGDLLRYLEREGYAENTLIAVGSDHGEAFSERGFEGHAREVYRETTEVPFVLAFPFRLEPGLVIDARSSNVDVWPTILDLIGVETPAESDGRSWAPEILAAAGEERAPQDGGRKAIAHLDQTWGGKGRDAMPTVAVTEGSLRYVRLEQPDGRTEQLFDAERDPAELDDVAEEEPEALGRLRAIADSYLESRPPWGEAPKREIDEFELNQLRALGYALP